MINVRRPIKVSSLRISLQILSGKIRSREKVFCYSCREQMPPEQLTIATNGIPVYYGYTICSEIKKRIEYGVSLMKVKVYTILITFHPFRLTNLSEHFYLVNGTLLVYL